MEPKKKILGVDFDDVIFKCDEAVMDFHNTKYGTSYERKDRTDFAFESVWNCTKEEVHARLNEFTQSEFHGNASPVLGAVDALKKLNETYEIVIVTGRPDSMRAPTLEWLSQHFLGLYREIHFTNHVAKSKILKDLGIEVFIEDAPHFASDVAESGIKVLLFDTPWNRVETPAGATRVHSWPEIVQILLG